MGGWRLRAARLLSADRRLSIKPLSYAIPTDGAAGELLRRVGRHPDRPAHTHFIVSAPGSKPVVTQLFIGGDHYLESDAVFGVEASLIDDDALRADEWTAAYDFVLEPPPAA